MEFKAKKYSWGVVNFKTSAETVGSVLESIESKNGEVTSKLFLDASRPESSPTHSMFEWDDSVAAEKYRLQQSSNIITHLKVEYVESDPEEVAVSISQVTESTTPKYFVPAFVTPDKPCINNPSSFTSFEKAMSDEETRQKILERAIAELKSIRTKYATLVELANVFANIDALEEEKEA